MAPPNIQQLLQGGLQQVKGHIGNPGGPFDTYFDISNFLRHLEHKQSPAYGKQQGFRLHFPFPFSALSFIRKRGKNTQVLDSSTIAHSLVVSSTVDLEIRNELNKQVHSLKDEEDSEDTTVMDGHHTCDHSNKKYFSTSMELQNLQRQLEIMDLASAPASKESLGHATWTFLHTLAAQFPEKPTRQQQRDAKELMAILSRLYPCKECADHFKEVLKANPVQAGSGVQLAQWMCRVHNVVNRSLGKSIFPCQRVDARWGALDCEEGACDLQGRMH
ncbi:hypothetical protein GOP47_0017459 [Adiantum capillus-veneris]|uniref:Sulfhydryl oxidase n=1 Tax=Adiantum capillus-veneris TaxID=13818 RepID=A0A9D4UGL6_ADICA|nr:hypothetical protein GOP47_0017459 [Adiantum capillus-veneris]